MSNSLSNKEALALLRIGLEDETDLSAPVLAEPEMTEYQMAAGMSPRHSGEARESNPMVTEPTGPDSRGAQFISPTDRGLFLLATLPTTGTNQ